MPIITINSRLPKVGNLRLGCKVEGTTKEGKKYTRPGKLDHFRITSPRKEILEEVAEIYGGEVAEWPDSPEGDSWQLFTTANELQVIVVDAAQWMEYWGGGECKHRCDGVTEQTTGEVCNCGTDPAARIRFGGNKPDKPEDCVKPYTRVSCLLAGVSGLGAFLLTTTGAIAAAELYLPAEAMAQRFRRGEFLQVTLSIRSVKGKKNYVVPQLIVPLTPEAALEATLDEIPALPPGTEAEEIAKNQRALSRAVQAPRSVIADDPFNAGTDPDPFAFMDDEEHSAGVVGTPVIGRTSTYTPPSAPPADVLTTPTSGDYAKPILVSQTKRIHQLKNLLALSDADYRAKLQDRWSVTTSKDLTKGLANEVIAALENRAKQEGLL